MNYFFKVKIIVLCAIILFGISCDNASEPQKANLYGSVKDRDGKALGNSQIILSPTGQQTSTGNDGHYEFVDLKAQKYTVTASKDGYSEDYQEIVIKENETLKLDFMLYKTSEVNEKLKVFPNTLDFLKDKSKLSFQLSQKIASDNEIQYQIIQSPPYDWLQVYPAVGSLTTEVDNITVEINRFMIPKGNYQVSLIINSPQSISQKVELLIQSE